jgi:outer membrane cobalamin receptor
MKKSLVALGILVSLGIAPGARAASDGDALPADANSDADTSTTLSTVEVNAKLDTSRNQLSPETGASQYVISQQAIDQLPLGDATPFNQVLLQVPGFVQDSYGQLHVRGDHADLQYRINGVIIPESISGFGQTLDARIINQVQVLTGALPAQYGYRTAGVVDISTKTPEEGTSGSVGITGGSFGTLNPNFTLLGTQDRWSYFLTGSFLESDIGIENPTDSRNAIHDHTDQSKGFGNLSYLLN